MGFSRGNRLIVRNLGEATRGFRRLRYDANGAYVVGWAVAEVVQEISK